MPREKKYLEGFRSLYFNVSVSSYQKIEDYATKNNLTKTEVIDKAINLLGTPELDRLLTLQSKINTQEKELKELRDLVPVTIEQNEMLKEVAKMSLRFEITNKLTHFDNTRFGTYESVKLSIDNLSLFITQAIGGDFEQETTNALKFRLDFLYSVALPDIYKYIYQSEGRIYGDSLWYSFKDYFEGGFKRPDPPGYVHIIDPAQRARAKESENLAKRFGLPYSKNLLLGSDLRQLESDEERI